MEKLKSILTLLFWVGCLWILIHTIYGIMTKKVEKYSTRCVEVFSLPVPIYRCENAEVICYNSAAEGMLYCEGK